VILDQGIKKNIKKIKILMKRFLRFGGLVCRARNSEKNLSGNDIQQHATCNQFSICKPLSQNEDRTYSSFLEINPDSLRAISCLACCII